MRNDHSQAIASSVSRRDFLKAGGGWRSDRWDHWPVGWLNSQLHHYQPGSPYPYHFCPFSHYMLSKRIVDCPKPESIAGLDWP
jgi:hypothetical protein